MVSRTGETALRACGHGEMVDLTAGLAGSLEGVGSTEGTVAAFVGDCEGA